MKTLNETIADVLVATCGNFDREILLHFLNGWVGERSSGQEYRFEGLLGHGGKFYPKYRNGKLVSAVVDCYQEDKNPVRRERIHQANELLAEVIAGYRPTEFIVNPAVHIGFELKIPAGTRVENLNDATSDRVGSNDVTRIVTAVGYGASGTDIDYASAYYGVGSEFRVALTDSVLEANSLVPEPLFTLPANDLR
jgi:hypothetical protein